MRTCWCGEALLRRVGGTLAYSCTFERSHVQSTLTLHAQEGCSRCTTCPRGASFDAGSDGSQRSRAGRMRRERGGRVQGAVLDGPHGGFGRRRGDPNGHGHSFRHPCGIPHTLGRGHCSSNFQGESQADPEASAAVPM